MSEDKNIFYDHKNNPHIKPEDDPINWRPSAYGILVNDEGKWLMNKPSWNDRWEFPGGGVEPYETLEEGLVREFFEETGYKVRPISEPIAVFERNFCHPTIGFCHVLSFVYFVERVDDSVDKSVINTFALEEVVDTDWKDPKDLVEDEVAIIQWKAIKKARGDE